MMTKRRWRLFIFVVVLLIGAFIIQSREKGEEAAIMHILDNASARDAVELLQGEQSLFRAEGEDAITYLEKNPLSHVKDISKKERALFEEEPVYHIVYEMDGQPLYEVDILKVAISSELSDELQSLLFTVNESLYLIYWADEKKALEQSMHTQRLLEQFGQ